MQPLATATRLRILLGRLLFDNFWVILGFFGRMHPLTMARIWGLRRTRNIAYGQEDPAQRLDIWQPLPTGEPRPVLLYIHGGAFRILSKDSHWLMAIRFAIRGYVVVNINYRMAPKHRFPAAVQDAALALHWLHAHIADYGGDPNCVVFAGESAGGNIVTALMLACCFVRPDAFARDVFALGLVPRAVLPACAVLQLTDPHRFHQLEPDLWSLLQDRLDELPGDYLGETAPTDSTFFDPILLLESEVLPDRPLPPIFAGCGTADPLWHDTVRLGKALLKRGVVHRTQLYPKQFHAFHAMVSGKAVRQYWRDQFAFLETVGLPAKRLRHKPLT